MIYIGNLFNSWCNITKSAWFSSETPTPPITTRTTNILAPTFDLQLPDRPTLEALACGTPVVATSVGGIPEQVKDGITGYLTPPADADAMATRIVRLLEDDGLRQRMGVQAAEDAKQRFDHEGQVNEYLKWYEEIVCEWQPEP